MKTSDFSLENLVDFFCSNSAYNFFLTYFKCCTKYWHNHCHYCFTYVWALTFPPTICFSFFPSCELIRIQTGCLQYLEYLETYWNINSPCRWLILGKIHKGMLEVEAHHWRTEMEIKIPCMAENLGAHVNSSFWIILICEFYVVLKWTAPGVALFSVHRRGDRERQHEATSRRQWRAYACPSSLAAMESLMS